MFVSAPVKTPVTVGPDNVGHGMAAERDERREQDGGEHEAVRADAAPPERRDEAGAARDPDRVDEDREPERPQRLRELEAWVDRADGDPGEEDCRDAEREASDPDPRE